LRTDRGSRGWQRPCGRVGPIFSDPAMKRSDSRGSHLPPLFPKPAPPFWVIITKRSCPAPRPIMHPRTTFLVCLALFIPASARADGPKDPLRFVPRQAEVVAKIERPRALLEAIEKHELVQEAFKISGIRDLYDSTNQRRLYQLIAYFEKELGKNKYELLDALS